MALNSLQAAVRDLKEAMKQPEPDLPRLQNASERVCEKDREAHKTLIDLVIVRRESPDRKGFEFKESIRTFRMARAVLAAALAGPLKNDPRCSRYHEYVSDRLKEATKPKRLMEEYVLRPSREL